MNTERPDDDALCRFVNGAERPVDVHANYHDEAALTVEPEPDYGPLREIVDDVRELFDGGDETRAPHVVPGDVVALATEQQGQGIDEAASADLVTEAETLQARLAGD